jgi:MFS family permease
VADRAVADVRLGIRANLSQFLFLTLVSVLIGGTVGQERAIVPLLAQRSFGVRAVTTATAFVAAYGLAKAVANLAAAALSDRIGRRPVMIWGWLLGIPVPLLIMWAPSWGWVIAANLLLGAHDGLTSSSLVIMTIDLVGSARRGVSMGISAGAGYLGVAGAAFLAGVIAARHGLRPEPLFVGLASAVAGLAIAVLVMRETRGHAHHEAVAGHGSWSLPHGVALREAFGLVTLREPAMSACVQAGFVNNLNDGVAWGIFPLLFAARDLDIEAIAFLAALYPATWGLAQFATGAVSDRLGRKWIIAAGMWVQGAALATVAAGDGMGIWVVAVVALGLGTAMVYPTLLAAVGDAAPPRWRASALGIYRLWRELGLVAGAAAGGLLADAFGLPAAIAVVAAVTAASGAVVAIRMVETGARPTRAVRAPSA